MIFYIRKIATGYTKHIEDSSKPYLDSRQVDIDYLINALFIKVILYALPMAVVTTVAVVIIESLNGHFVTASLDSFYCCVLTIVLTNKRLSLVFRKHFMIFLMAAFSISSIAVLGSFEIGGTYLLAMSIFVSISFSRKLAFFSLLLNFSICAGFYLLIKFHLFNSPLQCRYTAVSWLIAAMNFLFINCSLVILTRYLIERLKELITLADDRTAAVQIQNGKLKDIAYMHSHLVRAPLAKIVGLIGLLDMAERPEPEQEILVYLNDSSKELDDVIRSIVDQTKPLRE